MAHGIRQGIFAMPSNGMAKEDEKEGAACTAGNAALPILSDMVNPKIARAYPHTTDTQDKAVNSMVISHYLNISAPATPHNICL